MAQAAVDLPDPLDRTAESAANTDDLLSQLAGNEIDRLLAEADSDHAPKLFKPIKNPSLIPEPQAVRGEPSKPHVAEQLDQTLEKIDQGARSPAPERKETIDSAAREQAESEADGKERAAVFDAAGFESGPGQVPVVPVESDSTVQSGGSEREALLTAAGFDSTAGGGLTATTSDFESPAPDYTPPLPLFLKPLQFINAPLEACPDHVRQLLGKLAIVTLINAAAGLAYVFFFKKH